MADSGLALRALLLKEVVPHRACCGRQVLLLLVLLISLGFAVILSCVPRGDQQHLPIQEATITMAHRFQILPTALKHFKALPMASKRLRSFPAAPDHFQRLQASFRDINVPEQRAVAEAMLPGASVAEVMEAGAETRAETGPGSGEQPTRWEEEGQGGIKAWAVGAMNVTDPLTIELYNHPLMTTIQNHPPVKGVLAWSDRAEQAHFLNGKLAHLRQSVVDLTKHGVSAVKQYGVAGFVSVVVESVLYWLFILVPASAYMYHAGPGAIDEAWLPTLSDPESVAEFGKLIGGAYVFSKIPPIEAARWAWAAAMVPWFQERLPASLEGGPKIITPSVVDAPSEPDDRAQQD